MSSGFIILAQNNAEVDYIKCAEVLAKNIKRLMPNQHVTLLTDSKITNSAFDNIALFPAGDQAQDHDWKLQNDWQVYEASPYTYTIKLEADIYLPRRIDHWWEVLQKRDLVISTTARDFKSQITPVRFYRKIIDANSLPDCYNAITYFKKSSLAQEFFTVVRDIFENWDEYKKLLKYADSEVIATTDIVYSLAARIISEEHCTLPGFTAMSIIHMKQMINSGRMSDWTREYLYEISTQAFRINTIPQLYPVHYHIKDFATVIEQELGHG